jgi:anti-sigma B factor antagonist
MMLCIAKQAKKDGKAFVLSGAAGMVKEVLEAAGMDMLVTFCDSVDDLP